MNVNVVHNKDLATRNDCLKKQSSHLPPGVGRWWSARFCMVYMGLLGFVNVYALRVNLSVAIVSMENSSYLINSNNNTKNECITNSSQQNVTTKGEFNWNGDQRGLVLGAFFYGYIVTQIPGGYLASRYGGKIVFGAGILTSSVLSLLTPVAARTSFALLIALRVVEGVAQGVTYPAMHAMLGVWAPSMERSRMVSLVASGCAIGTVLAQTLSGILCASDVMGGWPSAFYIFGILGIVWCGGWFLFAHSSPAEHPRISPQELEFIECNIEPRDASLSVPWLEIATSKAVWAMSIAGVADSWGLYTLLTCLPLFLSSVLGFSTTQDGLFSALPYVVAIISSNLAAIVTDMLIEKGILTTTQARKLMTFISMNGGALCLVSAGYVGCNKAAVVSLICLAKAFNGLVTSGYSANRIDLAPKYAGILMGVTNSWSTISGMVSPSVVGALTGNNSDHQHWLYVFYLTAGIYFIGSAAYVWLGTAVEQEWNKRSYTRERDDEKRHILAKEC